MTASLKRFATSGAGSDQDGRVDPIVAGAGGTAGAGDLVQLTRSGGEPASIGAPPVIPALVSEGGYDIGGGAAVRRVPVVSGHVVSGPTCVGSRARYTVEWSGLIATQKSTLVAWLLDDLVLSPAGGSLLAFDLEVDGPGTGVVPVRVVSAGADWVSQRVRWSEIAGVWSVGPLLCEEVL